MKAGIMQPYFLPYLAYWQLMKLVDIYVIYDDVHYIKRGWMNRNRIILNKKITYINVPIEKASQNKKICDIQIEGTRELLRKSLRKIEEAYKKAPFFSKAFPVLQRVFSHPERNLSRFLYHSFLEISQYLGIHTPLIFSSEIPKNDGLRGEDKIIDICKKLHVREYVNPIGGRKLYHEKNFKKEGMELSFLRGDDICYRQFGGEFIPNLSIVDVMMFNSCEDIASLLGAYTLVKEVEGDICKKG